MRMKCFMYQVFLVLVLISACMEVACHSLLFNDGKLFMTQLVLSLLPILSHFFYRVYTHILIFIRLSTIVSYLSLILIFNTHILPLFSFVQVDLGWSC